MERWATISEDGRYRFDLGRAWLPDHPRMMFLMCNPSTADARHDDPTIRRCIRFASDHRCGSIEVVNLWPFRTAYPAQLWIALSNERVPCGPLETNIDHVCRAAQRADFRVMAFGSGPMTHNPGYVRTMVDLVGHCGPLFVLGTTASGTPLHPLARGKQAIRNGTMIQPWSWPQQEEPR